MSPIVSTIVGSIISTILETPLPAEAPPAAYYYSIRNFPAGVNYYGTLAGAPAYGKVIIDGKAYPTAPGFWIRDESNRIVFAGSMTGSDYLIAYQKDYMGNIWRAWILNPAEVAAVARIPRTLPAPLPIYGDLPEAQ
jgi:hypothetical protein